MKVVLLFFGVIFIVGAVPPVSFSKKVSSRCEKNPSHDPLPGEDSPTSWLFGSEEIHKAVGLLQDMNARLLSLFTAKARPIHDSNAVPNRAYPEITTPPPRW